MKWVGVALLAGRLVGDIVSSSDPIVTLANYGLLGLIAVGFFTGRLVSANLYNAAIADRDREHAELVALRIKTEDQFIPAIVRSTETMARFLDRTSH